MLRIEDARELWSPASTYLNTASFGLPPRPAWEALQQALEDWRRGSTSWEPWCDATERSRELFARLVGVATDQVATGGSVSYLVGLIAASVRDGARVVAPEIDFSSLLWPFLAQSDRGVTVETVPLARLADSIDERTDVVAFSAVQSATGELADLDAISAAARAWGALTVVDATHACGWLPIDASRFDAFACAAYKWLMSPRGTAFLAVADRLLDRLRPHAANWYAGEDPFGTYYGPSLRLAREARRLDQSPAWFSWIGTAPAIEVVLEIGVDAIHAHDLSLANRFRQGLGLDASGSPIVKVELPGAGEKLARAGMHAAIRDGSLRASFHVYNTEADVDTALGALANP